MGEQSDVQGCDQVGLAVLGSQGYAPRLASGQ